jgi:hypothetical protein
LHNPYQTDAGQKA